MSERILNAPNLVAGARLLLSPILVLAAAQGRETAFVVLFLGLEAADALDGILARVLHQETTFGARLDSVADLVMYTCLLMGLAWMEGDLFLAEWPWMGVAVVSYAVSWGASIARFGRLPSYHTWSAKLSSVLAMAAAVVLVLWGEPLLVRVAAVTVTAANVEALVMTRLLDEPRRDLPSVLPLLRGRGGE